MFISVDGGSLCQRFYTGNRVFTENLLKSCALYDKKNQYIVYTFCHKKIKLGKNIHLKKITPTFGWAKFQLSKEELFFPKNIFLGLNQSIPFYVSGKIISFSHGLSFYFYPQYYPDSAKKMKSQLDQMVKKSTYLIVSSKKVLNELQEIYPEKFHNKFKVIPFGVPFDMILRQKSKNKKSNYFLFVGMNHPIKNIEFLQKIFGDFKKKISKKINLIKITKSTSRQKLRKLYQQALALVTVSYYESFNLPVLEALSQNCPVIGLKSAIIPELREFVNIADDREQLEDYLEKAVNNQLKEINIQSLYKKFNWKDYLNQLTNLY